MNAERLLQAISVAAELTATQLTDAAKAAMVEDLLGYEESALLTALQRCRRELSAGRLTLAAIIDRLSGDDWHPGPEEAWATCLLAQDERNTVVWTTVMRDAFHGAAKPLLDAGDQVGARMAFKERYARLMGVAGQVLPRWEVSVGWDQDLRAQALHAAVEARQLSDAQAAMLLPPPALQLDMLPAPDESLMAAAVRANIQRLRDALCSGFDRRSAQAAAEREQLEHRKAESRAAVQAHLDAANAEVGRIAHG